MTQLRFGTERHVEFEFDEFDEPDDSSALKTQ